MLYKLVGKRVISIHALREEGDRSVYSAQAATYVFLSTPSARRATIPIEIAQIIVKNFYPRPPRGGRHVLDHKPRNGQ